MASVGKFCIDRALFENPLWQDRPFTKGQAWIDLIGHAEYEDTKVLKGYELFNVKRGQLLITLKELSDRWGWTSSKVNSFLGFLENENQIKRKTKNKGTLITVENYNFYQFENSKTKNEQKTNKKPTENEQKTNEKSTSYKKENKDNKVKKNTRTRVTVDEILSTAPPELLDSLDAFIEMRNKIKAPLTGEALKQTLKKVNTLSGGDMKLANDIILQSVERSWRGVFALKEDFKSNNGIVDVMDL